MARLKMLAVICLCFAASVQCAVWLETSWNQKTGNSEEALTDGFRWNGISGTYALDMLKAETGGVAGNNMMGIWLNNEYYAHVQMTYLPIQQYDDFYYRFYVRVYPKNGIRYPNFHGIQNYDWNYPSNFYFSVRDEGNANTWDCAFGTYAAQLDSMDKAYFTGGLAFNEWYRVEGHIKWFNHADWAAPTIWVIRIYNSNNVLVRSEKDFVSYKTRLRPEAERVTLKSEYDAGKKFYINGTTYTWAMGSNGPYGGTGQGRIHDVSCVALGSDSSILGPVTGKVAAIDNLKPFAENLFPKAGTTGVSATTAISLYLKEIGMGLDSQSVTMRLNGLMIKPSLSGAIWNCKVFYKPASALPAGDLVTIRVTAKDLANPANSIDTTYSFTVAGVSGLAPMQGMTSVRGISGVTIYNFTGQRLNSGTPASIHGQTRNAKMPYLILQGKNKAERKIF